MTNKSDSSITREDVQQLDRERRGGQMLERVVELLGREPQLLIAMTDTWEKINSTMDWMGLNEAQKRAMKREITVHTTRALILLDHAHRRLWADLLPDDPNAGDHDAE